MNFQKYFYLSLFHHFFSIFKHFQSFDLVDAIGILSILAPLPLSTYPAYSKGVLPPLPPLLCSIWREILNWQWISLYIQRLFSAHISFLNLLFSHISATIFCHHDWEFGFICHRLSNFFISFTLTNCCLDCRQNGRATNCHQKKTLAPFMCWKEPNWNQSGIPRLLSGMWQ